jgi:hypothetical protein
MNEKITKPCSKCGIPKTLDEFGRNKMGKYGRASTCKECRRAQAVDYNARPDVKARKLDWARRNSKQANESSRRWQKNNPERRNETARKWAMANKTKARASVKKWIKAHPDKVREYARRHQRRRIARNPEKHKARWAVNNAIAMGKIPRASTFICSECGMHQASQYHHHNGYDEEHRLDVKPVCGKCHRNLHWE